MKGGVRMRKGGEATVAPESTNPAAKPEIPVSYSARLSCKGGNTLTIYAAKGRFNHRQTWNAGSFAAEAGAVRSMGRQVTGMRRRPAICSIERDPIHG